MADTSPPAPESDGGYDGRLSDQQALAIVWVRVSMSALSLAGTSSVLLVSLCLRQWKTTASRLVLYLLASSLVASLANLLSIGIGAKPELDPLCIAQAIIMQFGQVMEFAWVTAIAVHLLWGLVLKKGTTLKFEIILLGFVYFGAFLLTILPCLTSDYGPAGYWCWITSADKLGHMWQLVAFYVPLSCCTTVMIVIYVLVFRMAYKTFAKSRMSLLLARNGPRTSYQIMMQQLAIYPVVFVLVWIFPMVNRIQNWISDNDVFILYLLQVCTAPLLGFFNSIFYAYDLSLFSKLRNTLRHHRVCECCCGGGPPLDEMRPESSKQLTGTGMATSESLSGGSTTYHSTVIPSISSSAQDGFFKSGGGITTTVNL
ncbi:slime mold cyclic amp receptor protein [Pelomyxa schiedti]|nr:slime mold cyclic amp receptor protein [Pelomyxa schiedti]